MAEQLRDRVKRLEREKKQLALRVRRLETSLREKKAGENRKAVSLRDEIVRASEGAAQKASENRTWLSNLECKLAGVDHEARYRDKEHANEIDDIWKTMKGADKLVRDLQFMLAQVKRERDHLVKERQMIMSRSLII